jgi:three-Cys-motif partner protein
MPIMPTATFFTDQSQQSRTKAQIVSKYFNAWSRAICRAARSRGEVIQYVDLFSGPGRYDDGSDSTPILVLKHAIANPNLHPLFHAVFNDADPDKASQLREAIKDLQGIKLLKHPPVVHSEPVDYQIARLFERQHLPPTLTFADPFGYKGLSMRLIRGALKDWGCEIIFFFNFNRVNAAIYHPNDGVENHVCQLFEEYDAASVRDRLADLQPHEREGRLMEELAAAIKRQHAQYVLQFRFLNDSASRTSHHLVFATKSTLGCKIMKEIMAKESSWADGGLPSYTCSPKPVQRSLFDSVRDPAAELAEELPKLFAGRELTVGEIYRKHGLERQHKEHHYKDALRRLEAAGKVTVYSAKRRPAGTMADHVTIRFLPEGG